jgi:ribosome-associated protein
MFVIASGSSVRHIKSMADNLIVKAKEAGVQPLGVEGDRQAEWVLVDLNDIIVHLMLPQTRAFYNLEKLWEASSQQRSGHQPAG